jgi:hypothetical protein
VGLRAVLPAGWTAALVTALAGCGGEDRPPDVQVSAGPQEVSLRPTQYCLDGEGQRYDVTPPFVEVSPDTPIRLTVPEPVAERGWSVQVFDERLTEKLGTVDVEPGTASFDGINSSDVVPPAFYLVVVEDKGGDCENLAGAWPVAFLRAGG